MIKRKSGFTLVELLITILMSGLVLAAASSAFVGLLKHSRTQGGIVESNINLIGINMLRRDIEGAGTGLTWDNFVAIAYAEGPNLFTNPAPATVIDAPNGTPRAIVSVNAATYNAPNDMFDNSDYLVIKSTSVAQNDASVLWSYVRNTGAVFQWTSSNPSENFQDNDRVIVLDPRNKTSLPLIDDGSDFYAIYDAGAGGLPNNSFWPTDINETYLVYGIADINPVRPFNRADYFIALPAANMPVRCAPNTGILYKAVMGQDAAQTRDLQPIIDCVADMQVIFSLDNDNDGYFQNGVGGDTYSDDISDLGSMTAQNIRTQVKEVRVYILTHEGGRDRNYSHVSPIYVGEPGLGRSVNLGANLNYRWKVYQMIVKPFNLLQ
jgi:type IV pilus assembly protein PilW